MRVKNFRNKVSITDLLHSRYSVGKQLLLNVTSLMFLFSSVHISLPVPAPPSSHSHTIHTFIHFLSSQPLFEFLFSQSLLPSKTHRWSSLV